jgi:hypothetical protein
MLGRLENWEMVKIIGNALLLVMMFLASCRSPRSTMEFGSGNVQNLPENTPAFIEAEAVQVSEWNASEKPSTLVERIGHSETTKSIEKEFKCHLAIEPQSFASTETPSEVKKPKLQTVGFSMLSVLSLYSLVYFLFLAPWVWALWQASGVFGFVVFLIVLSAIFKGLFLMSTHHVRALVKSDAGLRKARSWAVWMTILLLILLSW